MYRQATKSTNNSREFLEKKKVNTRQNFDKQETLVDAPEGLATVRATAFTNCIFSAALQKRLLKQLLYFGR